jgi:riboflavin synthase
MFTGLVEAVGTIVDKTPMDGGARVRIAAPLAHEVGLGDSVAINGVCLTALVAGGPEFIADVGPETLRVTTLDGLRVGSSVNLERPMRGDGRFGGHFVQGHVDAVGVIVALKPEAEFLWMSIEVPAALAPFIVLKGSIAVDGISLTVARLDGNHIDIQLVPFTVEHTNIKNARVGDQVNIECDMVGKYVARAVEHFVAGTASQREAAGEV